MSLWIRRAAALACVFAAGAMSQGARAADPWLVFTGSEGPGVGKHVVLISGDEEYRSEEALPQLAKILAEQHGFTCTVLFAIDPDSGIINPNYRHNIPGLDRLDSADLMVISTRFRDLPDDQMERIDAYLKAGRPVIGLRTATHAFQIGADSPWARYGNGYRGDETAWQGGFGRLVLGEMWIRHHGAHKQESTRGIIPDAAEDHPITRGIDDGDIWAPTDVYGVRLPLPGDSFPVVLGQVTARRGEYDDTDPLFGMRADDGPAVEGEKNDPMMPVAWTKSYQVPGGHKGRAFTTTMGASVDLLNSGVRRLLVNAVYWVLGMEDEIREDGTRADLIGVYEPTQFEFHDDAYWVERGLKPSDLE